MKLRLALVLFLFPLLPSDSSASGWQPWKVQTTVKFSMHLFTPHTQTGQLGPWYLYWPLEAHFQTPAPVAYPYWPTSPGGIPGAGPQQYPPVPAAGPALQPVGYSQQAPAYWYRR